MNTKNKQNRTSKEQKIREEHGSKKRGRNAETHHDQEQPETRLTR